MFEAVIVEDEQPILELMKVLIGRNPHYSITGAFSNPLEALSRLPELRPDVVFLDVEMPKMNGLELAKRISERLERTSIIFTTAYKEYALEAFEVRALDYLLKPVTPAAIDRITDRLLLQYRPSVSLAQQKSTVAIRCFGGLEVRNSAGGLIRFPTRKTEELLAYFLCHPGKDISKWQLVDTIWPELTGERASNNLHNTIYRLKKLLKEQELGLDIQKSNEGYWLETGDQSYDLAIFKQSEAAAAGQSLSIDQLERLCSLYQGPLLEGKPYLWKAPLEATYARRNEELTRQWVTCLLSRGEREKAEKCLLVYVLLDPLNEEMNRLLLELYMQSGDKGKLAKLYKQIAVAYRRELGIEPPRELRELRELRRP